MSVMYGLNSPPPRRRSCLGCLGRLFAWFFPLLALLVGGFWLSLVIDPPFGTARVARVLMLGLDGSAADEPRRSDTIILCAARVDGTGTLLLSIPRDARVRIPRHGREKINAAYALGKEPLLKQVLAQPAVLDADLPYHLIIDSDTVRAVVDALGGVVVTVPRDMKYDDNWGHLHINLKAGRQRLNGTQVVGYLRWRKNTHGGGESDFSRTERQRELLAALAKQARSVQGVLRLPHTYAAFRHHARTNLSLRQLIVLGWAARRIQSASVPGDGRTIGRASYVLCDWRAGRARWQAAAE